MIIRLIPCVLALATALSMRAADVTELIKKFPAQTAEDRDKVCADLFAEGADGIKTLCKMLAEPGKGGDAKARFALNGMAIYASRPGGDTERKLYAKTVTGELSGGAGPQVKVFLLTQLRLTAGDEEVAEIAKLLGDKEISDHVAQTLLTVRSASVAPAFRAALATVKDGARVTVITALGTLRDMESAPELLKDAENPDAAIKNAALHALANIGSSASIPALAKAASVDALFDRNQAYQATLLLAHRLVELGKNEEAAQVCRTLIKANPVAGEHTYHIQCAALDVLSEALVEGAFDDLKAALKNESVEVRATSLKIASSIPGTSVTLRWAAELKGDDPKFAVEILAVLQRRGDPAGFPAVAEQMKSADKRVRIAAIAAAVIGGKAALPALEAVFAQDAKDNGDEQAAARVALSRLKGEKINAALAEALNGAPLNLRKALIGALADRGSVENLPILTAAITDGDAGIRATAFDALGLLGDTKVLPALLDVITKTESDADRVAAEKAAAAIAARQENRAGSVPLLSKALASAPVKAKQPILRVLGKVGGPEALNALKPSLKDAAPEVADTAIRELANWPDASAIESLLDVAKNDKELTHYVLTLKGYLRLLAATGAKPGNELLPRYKVALELCRRTEEKTQVISGIQTVKTPEAAAMVEGLMGDDALREAACSAALAIAKELAKGNKPKELAESHAAAAREAFQKVIATSKNEGLKKDAQTELGKLKK